jgi:hypothetical protein
VAANGVAPARAVWRLGDYHRFAREQMWRPVPSLSRRVGSPSVSESSTWRPGRVVANRYLRGAVTHVLLLSAECFVERHSRMVRHDNRRFLYHPLVLRRSGGHDPYRLRQHSRAD